MIANGIFQRGKIENSNITSTWSFSLFLESFDYVFQNQISRQTINTFWIGRYFTSTCWTFYIGFQVRLVVRASVFLHPFCPCLRCTIRFQDFPRAWCTEIMRAWKNNRSLKKIQANRTRQLNLHCHRKKMSGLPWCGGYCFISACNLGCRWLQVWTKTWNSRAHYRACFHACPGYDSEFSPFFVCTWLCVGLQSIWCCSFPFMVYICRFQRKIRYARILLTRGIYIYLE